jgi:nucleotide-binding universal stress UspA family protein
MFDTVVIATDGSESASRAVEAALDLADRFDAAVHALFVVDERELDASPAQLRDDLADALATTAEDALAAVADHSDREVTTAVREGQPRTEVIRYADEVDADVVAAGTRGRHGDHGFLLGSVAEGLVRHCDQPVLTVRQLDDDERPLDT